MKSTRTSDQRKSLARRLALMATGGALMFYGRRGRLAGRLAATLGAAIAGRALAGHDDLAHLSRRRMPVAEQARLDLELDESFPASDPPSSTPMVGAMAR
jgi:hypothetical protein